MVSITSIWFSVFKSYLKVIISDCFILQVILSGNLSNNNPLDGLKNHTNGGSGEDQTKGTF